MCAGTIYQENSWTGYHDVGYCSGKN